MISQNQEKYLLVFQEQTWITSIITNIGTKWKIKLFLCEGITIQSNDIIYREIIIRLGVNMPARVENITRRSDVEVQFLGDPTGEFSDVVLFFGIIDILQDYDISKKLEHAYKSIQHDPTSISAVDPKLYAKRFKDFMYRAFTDEA